MRILFVSYHQYPAWSEMGCGPHPKQYPSGSAYHVHDLLARGLTENRHEVFYQLSKGAVAPPPPGVTFVSEPVANIDICHAIAALSFANPTIEFAASHAKPCLLTCHMDGRFRGFDPSSAGPNWVFVSQSLARLHHSGRFVLNGVDPANYCYSETKDDYLLYLGAMDKAVEKGLDVALALSVRKGFRLIVAGTGQTYEAIHRAADLCAAAGAEYIGDVRGPHKAELIARARAVLFPSRLNEGCPLVILEAMISGTPVLSSPSGGCRDLVTSDVGFLCEYPEDWDCAVDRLDGISTKRCREVALEKYHYRRMTDDYLREYQKEIDRFQA